MKLDEQYQSLLQDILDNGVEKVDRTGTGTRSVFGRQIRHNMQDGFPLLTTKKMAIKSIMTELKWFLKGDTNIKYLVDNGCNIWNGDAYKNYVLNMPYIEMQDVLRNDNLMTKEEFINKIKTDDEFAEKWGELGPIYGAGWRNWGGRKTDGFIEYEANGYDENIKGIDQIQNLINNFKTNPDSRRLIVSAWNVGELDHMVLPPCHYGFQVYTRELSYNEKVHEARKRFGFESEDGTRTFDINSKESIEFLTSSQRAISLMWNQRSVDTFLGLPFNIASYGMLLELIAKEVNMVPDELIGNLGDVHLYSNHIEQAKEQISREPYKLPTIELSNVDILNGEFDYKIKNYQSHSTIKAPLSN